LLTDSQQVIDGRSGHGLAAEIAPSSGSIVQSGYCGFNCDFHPPITTSASIVSDARTSTVSKEASFMMPSASYPGATLYLIRSIDGMVTARAVDQTFRNW
jgi:hypothetical protein